MMRYPEKQSQQDRYDHEKFGRISTVRPGARLNVRGFVDRQRGPVVMGVAVLTKVVSEQIDAALVPTKEYGRRWFSTSPGDPFIVIKELS